MIEQWLGNQQKRPVILMDLPEGEDLPYEDRDILYLPLKKGTASELAPLLANLLSHGYFISSRPWLNEGVAQWMTTLWTEHVAGRETAIAQIDAGRDALALAEPAHPSASDGQSLIAAYSDIYYRDKATFVLWMLREQIGESALGQALRSYNPAQDHEPSYLQRLTQAPSNKSAKDNEWFFDDWVYRDRGLPDLKIVSVYSRTILRGNVKNYLISVTVRNEGDCSAEVPVQLQSEMASESSRLLVPARGEATVRILMQSNPSRVTVNDGTVPEIETSLHTQAVENLGAGAGGLQPKH